MNRQNVQEETNKFADYIVTQWCSARQPNLGKPVTQENVQEKN